MPEGRDRPFSPFVSTARGQHLSPEMAAQQIFADQMHVSWMAYSSPSLCRQETAVCPDGRRGLSRQLCRRGRAAPSVLGARCCWARVPGPGRGCGVGVGLWGQDWLGRGAPLISCPHLGAQRGCTHTCSCPVFWSQAPSAPLATRHRPHCSSPVPCFGVIAAWEPGALGEGGAVAWLRPPWRPRPCCSLVSVPVVEAGRRMDTAIWWCLQSVWGLSLVSGQPPIT